MTLQRITLALLAFSFVPASLQANDPARDWPIPRPREWRIPG